MDVTSPNGKNPETMSSKGSMVTSSSRDSLYRHFDRLTKEEQVELIYTRAHVYVRVAHAHACAYMHVRFKHQCNFAPKSSYCTCMHKCTHSHSTSSHAGNLRRRDERRGSCRPFARTGNQGPSENALSESVERHAHVISVKRDSAVAGLVLYQQTPGRFS
jgi:hypothetical protein